MNDTPDIASLFRRLSSGVYVIGVTQGNRREAFTAASLAHVSYSPLLIMVAVNPDHRPYSLLGDGSAFAVSVLKEGQLATARHFGPHTNGHPDKLSHHAWRIGATGAPILEDALAYFECITTADLPAGDHRLILGTVIGGALVDGDASPMLYAQTEDMDGSRALYPATFDADVVAPPAGVQPPRSRSV